MSTDNASPDDPLVEFVDDQNRIVRRAPLNLTGPKRAPVFLTGRGWFVPTGPGRYRMA